MRFEASNKAPKPISQAATHNKGQIIMPKSCEKGRNTPIEATQKRLRHSSQSRQPHTHPYHERERGRPLHSLPPPDGAATSETYTTYILHVLHVVQGQNTHVCYHDNHLIQYYVMKLSCTEVPHLAEIAIIFYMYIIIISYIYMQRCTYNSTL